MVQGMAAVDWKKPENNAKLFAAVLAIIPGTPDYKKIATAFGPNVPASAISYRLNVVRKEGAALGFAPSSGSPTKTNGTVTPAKRTASANKKNTLKGKGRKRDLGDDSSDESDKPMTTDIEDSPTTPTKSSSKRQKVIGGRVTKCISPRKTVKTNYKELGDPFATMDNARDENGNNIFGEPSGTESEDAYATDGSFKEVSNDALIKVKEEAV